MNENNFIQIDNLVKTFGSTVAINNLSINIQKGELVSLLGPSGCGKTTLLRMLAGFEVPTGGSIKLRDQVINDIPPQKRKVGLVFQDYAVFPTMNVYKNVAYGLKIKKMDKQKIDELVRKYLDLVGLTGFENRMPSQLSGGQQQRVALARALVIEPDVLLLDEPLSNLDASLRLKVRKEIRKIQQNLGITTIFVTHDQEEAISISDKIFVIKLGELMQAGTPHSIYRNPANDFIANFIGRSNVKYGKITSRDKQTITVSMDGIELKVNDQDGVLPAGSDVWISMRPHYFRISKDGTEAHDTKENQFRGKVNYVEYLGSVTKGEIEISENLVFEFELSNSNLEDQVVFERGQAVTCQIDAENIVFGKTIRGIE